MIHFIMIMALVILGRHLLRWAHNYLFLAGIWAATQRLQSEVISFERRGAINPKYRPLISSGEQGVQIWWKRCRGAVSATAGKVWGEYWCRTVTLLDISDIAVKAANARIVSLRIMATTCSIFIKPNLWSQYGTFALKREVILCCLCGCPR